MASSAPPTEEALPDDAPHAALYAAVYNALFALPAYFTSDLNIAGVPTTDLQNFNTSLGATIEARAVETLNQMRSVWDPDKRYAEFVFVRQSQRFPDVILRTAAPEKRREILMGIELKGWYVLAKEGEPSYRFKVTPAVCKPQDLLVVFPWSLSNVISGSPRLFEPYVVGARHAAHYRNWHWEHGRTAREAGNTQITLSSAVQPYPSKADPITDAARGDKGGNFGRFARTGLMDAYMAELMRERLYGVPLSAWRRFLALFSEDRTEEEVTRGLDRLAVEAERERLSLPPDVAASLLTRLEEAITRLGRTD